MPYRPTGRQLSGRSWGPVAGAPRARGSRFVGGTVLGLLTGLVFGLHPTAASSQLLQGVVLDEETRSPLAATLVVLVDDSGRDRGRFLADASGSFRFTLPGPGRYALRAERLGAETSRLEGIRLGVGDTLTVRISMTTRPVALEGIEVRGESRCALAGDAGADTHEVWEAARKALESASLTDSLAVYRYELVRYRRVLDPTTLTVRERTESREGAWTRRPIVSRPIDVLADSGFVIRDPGGADRYYAPDADALLSDRFLDTHCFGLRAGSGDEAGLVGLEFRPIRGASRVADIEGVLWLDREDGGLRWLEFHYTHLPGALADLWTDDLGGRVEFRGLPDGNWIVSRWYVRMPVAEEVREPLVGRRVRLAAIAEEGGRVVRARRPGTPGVAFAGSAGAIVGEVRRSGAPDAGDGGSVVILGTGARSEVDGRRRFRIEGVAEGRYELAYVRPELMGLDASYPVAEVRVSRGDTSRVTVEPPPYGEVLAWACGAREWNPEAAVLLGEVVDAGTGVALTDTEVHVAWQTVTGLDLGRMQVRERTRTTRTDDRGAFRVCGVPTESTLRVTAEGGGGTSYRGSAFIPVGQPVASLVLDGSASRARVAEPRPPAGREGERPPPGERSAGRFIALVVDAGSGQPLAGAAVRLPDLSMGGVTGEGGRFEIPSVPTGRHLVEISHLGYATVRDTVPVEADRTSDARVELSVDAIALAPIEVTVERREIALETAGFYERRDEGWGRFIDLEDIEEQNPHEMTDLFDGLNGVTLVADRGSPLERYVLMRGGRSESRDPGLCFPMVVIDGTVVHRAGPDPARIDHLINSSAIAGVEVYPSSTGVPMQYAGTGSSCGVVLIWTRR